jgi:VanZ family protein
MDWLAGLSILILLLILSIPGDWVAAIEAWVKSLISLPQRPPSPGWLPTDKVVHVLLFLLTTLPVMLAVHLRHPMREPRQHSQVFRLVAMQTLLAMTVIAFLSEWIQSYVPGRSADPLDILADIIGIVAGITLILFLKKQA